MNAILDAILALIFSISFVTYVTFSTLLTISSRDLCYNTKPMYYEWSLIASIPILGVFGITLAVLAMIFGDFPDIWRLFLKSMACFVTMLAIILVSVYYAYPMRYHIRQCTGDDVPARIGNRNQYTAVQAFIDYNVCLL
ncbi:hypothetical protein RF11_15789 [Thelohanellus kitauei]|uniref:Uncharacterized protein n=1 Tax=Thelohanellus kitauei TaxID=669202 RepID=A0A0C2MWI6_THEKT|nr:hypothetical protein RF11_15789 [Thelohanellus kitauei]